MTKHKNHGHQKVRSRRSKNRLQEEIPRPFKAVDRIYTAEQQIEVLSACTSSAAVATFTAWNVSLNSFTQQASFTALFDQYRIVETEYRFVPRYVAADNNVVNAGLFHSVIDYDDSNLLAAVTDALSYNNCRMWSPGQNMNKLVLHFKPHVALAAFSGAFTSYANVVSPWLDCASSGVTHFGIKTAWTATSAVLVMDLYIRVKAEFKNLR
jgi:hypothetical protein